MPKKTTADVKKTKKKDFETVAEISAPATVPEIEVTPKKKILFVASESTPFIATGGLAEVIADHRSLLDVIERCDLAAFEPLVEKHLYGGIRRLGSKLTEEYADYFEPEK